MRLFGPPNVEKMKAKGDVKGLIKTLEYQKDAQVRRAAAEALGEIDSTQALRPLGNALGGEQMAVREEHDRPTHGNVERALRIGSTSSDRMIRPAQSSGCVSTPG